MNDWKALRKGTNCDTNTEWHYCCFSVRFKELKQEMPPRPQMDSETFIRCLPRVSAQNAENTKIKTRSLS